MNLPRAVAALASVALLLGAGSDPGFPPEVRTARLQYDSAVSRATTEYQHQCRTAADRYVGELKLGLKQAMKDEKLDDANKIKTEIETVQGGIGAAKADDPLSRLNGIWDVQFVPGNVVRYQFKGAVLESLAPPPDHLFGKVEVIGPNEIVTMLGNYTQRWTLAANRVYVESWAARQVEGKPLSIAVGVRGK